MITQARHNARLKRSAGWDARTFEGGQGVHTGTSLFKIATHDAAMEAADAVLQQRMDGAWQNRFDLLRAPAAPEASRALLERDVGLQSYAI